MSKWYSKKRKTKRNLRRKARRDLPKEESYDYEQEPSGDWRLPLEPVPNLLKWYILIVLVLCALTYLLKMNS